jgi:hypothetical protein
MKSATRRFVKRLDLERHLRAHGCIHVCEGGSHAFGKTPPIRFWSQGQESEKGSESVKNPQPVNRDG